MRNRTLPLVLAVLILPAVAHAQLRNVGLAFKPPGDGRVVGFHVYLAAASGAYTDFRDNIGYVPPVDASGVATYTLTGLEAYSDVYVSLKSYDASGVESAFSNEMLVAAEVPPVAPHECNVDTDCPAPSDPCAGPRKCVAFACVPGSPLPDETACNDGNASTLYDVCRGGTCMGFACGNDAQCSDGQACNGVELCSSNSCVPGTPLNCPLNAGPCYDSFCDATQGCLVQLHPDGTACLTSGSSSAGTCAAGVCQATVTPTPTPTPSPTPSPSPKKWRHGWRGQ